LPNLRRLLRRGSRLDRRLAVYGAYWFRGYSCNPRAIYEKARELVPECRGVWVVRRNAVGSIPPGVEYVHPRTPEYFDAINRAKYLINNVNFPNHLVKREGSVHVQTHHGTPLKHMGLDLRESESRGRGMDFDKLLERIARWDYSISSNRHSTEVWERVYPGAYETLEIGYPRNDVLANAMPETVAAARAALGIEAGWTAVLYAPTHREYEEGFVPRLDLAALADALGPGYVLLARLHYFYDSDPLVRELHDAGRLLDVASHPSVEELCLAADVLLTDYSSIMFDYAVLDRPIVIHAPDWDEYRRRRGVYFDLLADPPGAVTRTQEEVAAALAAPAKASRAAFRERFCALDDGRAAERAVRRIWGLG
jgi:CDP-glycerol glycerophosphotransferase